MTTLWRRGFVLVLAAASLSVIGCGGGGDGGRVNTLQTDIDELERLRDELTAAKTALERQVESEKTARETAESDLETAQENLTAATTRATTAEDDLETVRENLTAATTRATTAEDDLETERAAKMEAETNVAVLTERAAQLAQRLRTAEADKTKAETDLATAQEALETVRTTTGTELATANRRVMDLTAQVRTLTAQVTTLRGDTLAARTRAETDLAEARKALEAAQTTASTELATARQEVTDLRRQVRTLTETAATLREELRTAQAQAQAAAATADDDDTHPGLRDDDNGDDDDPPPVTPQRDPAPTRTTTQTAEANQRAQNLKTVFGNPTDTGAPTAAVSPVELTVSRGRVALARGGHSPGTLSGAGLRSATMALRSGGDSGKTVIYGNPELDRPVLEHFGSSRDSTDDTRLLLSGAGALAGAAALPAAGEIPHVATPRVDTVWRVSHGRTPSVTARDGDDDGTDITVDDLPATTRAARRANAYTGYLYGQPGQFVCSGGNCIVQVTPNYVMNAQTSTDELGRFDLRTVTVASVALQEDGSYANAGTLYFKPNSGAKYQLYTGGPVGRDTEYMVFGYWREDPTSSAGAYRFGVFAEVEAPDTAADIPSTFSATYDGVAVGAYVEQDPNDPVDTHRQGEFTADVFLEATGPEGVKGTIDDFVTTPTGGSAAPRTSTRWAVTLDDDNGVELNLAGGGEDTEGGWSHAFVPNHATVADATTAPPSAVTGVFNARIENSLHLVGAYGAEKR